MTHNQKIALVIALVTLVIVGIIWYTDVLWLLGVPPLLGLKAWLSRTNLNDPKALPQRLPPHPDDAAQRDALEALDVALDKARASEAEGIPILEKIREQKDALEADVASADVEKLTKEGNKLFGG
jgi:hypothetical protein